MFELDEPDASTGAEFVELEELWLENVAGPESVVTVDIVFGTVVDEITVVGVEIVVGVGTVGVIGIGTEDELLEFRDALLFENDDGEEDDDDENFDDSTGIET